MLFHHPKYFFSCFQHKSHEEHERFSFFYSMDYFVVFSRPLSDNVSHIKRGITGIYFFRIYSLSQYFTASTL